MDQGVSTRSATDGGSSNFELAPPRRFILPAILLLLSEQPGYGYGLVPRLHEFRFGHIDRPAVYRALAQLKQDGLVEASSQNPKAGQSRRVYHVTPLGERVLRVWMGVVKEEHDYLGQVVRRYQATGTIDSVLAEVEGGWTAALGSGWSPVSSTSGGRRPLVPVGPSSSALPPDPASYGGGISGSESDCSESDGSRGIDGTGTGCGSGSGGDVGMPAGPSRFRLIADRSVVLIDVRSTVGPMSFGATTVTGSIDAAVLNGSVDTNLPPSAHIEVDVSGLRSGNSFYDAELLRRIDARRFRTATVKLLDCVPSGAGNLYRLNGELTFHGVTRPAEGTVRVEVVSERRLVITGEQTFDIRDFALPSPTVLMLRIYPDVRLRFHAEAELVETTR